MAGQRLTDPDAQALRSELVDPWLVSVDALSERAGLTPAQARAEARLAIAVTRGLLLDLLATGDRTGADEAMRRFVGSMRPGAPPAPFALRTNSSAIAAVSSAPIRVALAG